MERKLRKPTLEETKKIREAIEEARSSVSRSRDLLAWADALREALLSRLGECEFIPNRSSVEIIKKQPDEDGLHMRDVLHL